MKKYEKDLVIEKAKTSDAKALIEYLNIVGGESDNLLFGKNEFTMTVEKEEEYIKNINKLQNSAIFVGKIDEKVVAVGSINSSQNKRINHHGELALSVKKEYWGQGIGYAMMEKIIDFAKENQVTKILTLGVKDDNVNGIKLYKKCGFEEVGVFKDFFQIDNKYYDKIIMNYYL